MKPTPAKAAWPLARALIAGLMSLLCANMSLASSYPERPLTILVPYPAGGIVDVAARRMAQHLSLQLKQSIVVDNRPGGGTLVGTRAVLARPADGYTLLMQSPTLLTNLAAEKAPGYKLDDFVPLGMVGVIATCLIVNNKQPGTLQEFLVKAKEKAQGLNVGDLGSTGTTILLTRRFMDSGALTGTMVSYKGAPDAMRAIVAGEIDMFFSPVPVVAAHAKSGTIKVLAVADERRSVSLPDVPTFAELGISGMSAPAWMAFFTVSGVPPDVVSTLRKAMDVVAQDPEYRSALLQLGVEPSAVSSNAISDFIKKDAVAWAKDTARSASSGK